MSKLFTTIRAAAGAAIVCTSLVGTTLAAAPAGAVASNVTLSASTATGGVDFATQAYGDPWDYDNSEDQAFATSATLGDMRSGSISGGRLWLDNPGGGYFSPITSWDDLGAAPWGRDGSLYPVDASRYTRLAFHMRAPQTTQGHLMWFTCGVASASCQGAKIFNVSAGWKTYDIPLTTGTSGQSWQGLIKGLRIFPSTAGGQLEIDWVRLYAPGQTTTVSFSDSTSSSAARVIWDADRNATNNTNANAGWGLLEATGSGSNRTFQAGALPGGTYQIGVLDDGQTSYASTALTVDAPPSPVVLDPDVTGGADYATLAGNPWDFNDASDVARVSNADWWVGNGLLYGRNAGSLPNDPHVVLSQPVPFDGSRFHRLTVRMGHEGDFSLEDRPGAGMNSRIVWSVTDQPGMAQVSDDLVVYPGWHTNTLEMATSPSNAIAEPGTPGQAGWAGRQIDQLRIDPNEDRGPRQWYIDDVRLAEDDTAYGGTFDVRFRDFEAQPGSTATLRADTNRSGCDGTVVASGVPVTAGVNTIRWAPRPVPAGTYWMCLTITDGRTTTSAYATGPLQMTSRPSPHVTGGSPIGRLDHIQRVPGGLNISGWAIDPDVIDPIDVHVYVGSTGVATRAALPRGDVGNAYPGYGAEHGYSVTVPATAGSHDVCAYAINVALGGTSLLGCQRVDVSSSPFGRVDRTRYVPGGIAFDGWALDPDVASPIQVHAYVGGSGAATTAGIARGDIGAAFPAYGANHGFSVVAPVTAGGQQHLCVYGINEGVGGTGVLSCPVVDVRVNPWGVLDVLQRVPGGVRVAGWAMDPSTAAPIDVHVYVGGAGYALRADQPRNDLLGPFPEWGAGHGYDQVLPVPAGPTQVCVYGINQGPGAHVLTACYEV